MKSNTFSKTDFENKLMALENILTSNKDLDIDILPLKKKIHDVMESLQTDTIKIVLLGSFSDGKTSTVAGFLGKVEDSMKIDPDESSDELVVYRPSGLKEGFEIVDTPGLFGTKEKEIDGSSIKFSEITKRYISEAHIIIYVTHAVNPIKDSHIPILMKVIKDYGKIDSLVIVLNRMDETGIDMSDDEDYEDMKSIKIANVKNRLQSSLGLTDSELERLSIVCIAANPKAKGLNYWLDESHIDRYNELSRIENLHDAISKVIDSSDVENLKLSQSVAVIKDLAQRAYSESVLAVAPVKIAMKKARKSHEVLKTDLDTLETELKASRKQIADSLDEYRRSLIDDINGATSMETLASLLESKIGLANKSIDYHLVTSRIERIISDNVEANEGSVKSCTQAFENSYNMQDDMFKEAFKKGIDGLKAVKVDGKMVLKIRDALKINHKFKPYGAIKFGKNIGKWAGRIGATLQFIMEAVDCIKSYKEKEKRIELQKNIKSDIESIFNDVSMMMTNNEVFYKNFFPSFILLRTSYQERLEEFEKLNNAISKYDKFQQDIKHWYGDDIIDVEYEEID